MNLFESIFFKLCLIWYLKLTASQSTYAVINKENCASDNSWTINKINSTIEFNVSISNSILSSSCMVYVTNEDFQANKVYTISVEITGNFSIFSRFGVNVYTGQPTLNKPVQTLSGLLKKWTSHLPSWDTYVTIMSYTVLEFTVKLTIKECNENCYQMNTASIIPTTIINVPSKCDSSHCIDNYAVSYTIRTNFILSSTCSLNFVLKNEPSICIAIGDFWTNSIIRSTKCRTTTFRLDNEVYLTLDRLIYKPWCLPWKSKARIMTITWEDGIEVTGQSLCTVTIYTNTTVQGDQCVVPTQTTSGQVEKADNTGLMVGITVASLAILIIGTILVLYVIVKRGQRGVDRPIVANFHTHSSVQFISPPPYSVAIQDSAPPYDNGTIHANVVSTSHILQTSEENILTERRISDSSDSTSSDSGITSMTENDHAHVGPPPPYSES